MITVKKENLYPMLFESFYKSIFWGGNRLTSCMNRKLPEDAGPIGEAWDLCDKPGMESAVINGPLYGTSIHELLEHFGTEFAGTKYRGGRFPITVKLVDTAEHVPVQVHPAESYCQEHPELPCKSNTKMWYILRSEPEARVFLGLKNTTIRQQFLDHLASPQIEHDIHCFNSVPGDVYFINSGRLHAIGGGNMLLEIQQNEGSVYTLYDWGHAKSAGREPELQLEQGIACMDFIDRTVGRIPGASDTVRHNRKYPVINRCPFFQCDDLKLVDEWRDSTEKDGSFHLLTAVNAPIRVENARFSTPVPTGATVLIPACFGRYLVKVTPGITTTVIRTTL